MNLADFTKGFDMSSIMSQTIEKNFVPGVPGSFVKEHNNSFSQDDLSQDLLLTPYSFIFKMAEGGSD